MRCRMARIVVMAMIGAVLVAPGLARAHAPSILLKGFGTASVDGRLGAGEWTRAAKASFDVETPLGSRNATAYFMNDRERLYFAVVVPFPRPSWTRATFWFDADHDGSATVGVDDVTQVDHGVASGVDRISSRDEHICGADPIRTCFDSTSTRNLQRGSIGTDGTNSTYELSKPLLGDAGDIKAAPGDIVGFLVGWDMCLAAACSGGAERWHYATYWPAPRWDTWGMFGDLLVSAPPPIASLVFRFAPSTPRAGRGFRLAASAVVRQGGAVDVVDAKRCAARIGAAALRQRAPCEWVVPTTSRGKRLTVTITARVGTEVRTATRSFGIS